MKFNENEIKVNFLVPPIESNAVLITLSIKDDIKLRILIDSNKKEIWVDRHEDSNEIFKDFTIKDGNIA